jgi:MFS-type transporter involved in bile tolerance (Atg22 family)
LKQLNLNASQLGFLFTSLSIGSVLGAVFVVPTVRAKFSPNRVTILATALLILVYFLMGCIRQPQAFLLVAGVAGVAWTVVASEIAREEVDLRDVVASIFQYEAPESSAPLRGKARAR